MISILIAVSVRVADSVKPQCKKDVLLVDTFYGFNVLSNHRPLNPPTITCIQCGVNVRSMRHGELLHFQGDRFSHLNYQPVVAKSFEHHRWCPSVRLLVISAPGIYSNTILLFHWKALDRFTNQTTRYKRYQFRNFVDFGNHIKVHHVAHFC